MSAIAEDLTRCDASRGVRGRCEHDAKGVCLACGGCVCGVHGRDGYCTTCRRVTGGRSRVLYFAALDDMADRETTVFWDELAHARARRAERALRSARTFSTVEEALK